MELFFQGADGAMFGRPAPPSPPWPEADITIVDQATFACRRATNQLHKKICSSSRKPTPPGPILSLARKTDLVSQLHQWGYNEDNVRVLFRIIDAMMALPEPLETVFEEAIRKIEEETQMTYITSVEPQITRKFGVLPDWAKVRLVSADEVSLNHWAEQILDAQCIEDVFK